MDFSREFACLDGILGHGWESPKINSVSDIFEYCEVTLEGNTHRNTTMGNMLGNLDYRSAATPGICSENSEPLLEPLEHALEQVKRFLDSFEASKELSLEEECVILGPDVGPCWDDVQDYEGTEFITQIEPLPADGKENAQVLFATCPKDYEQTQKSLNVVGEVHERDVDVPSTIKGDLNYGIVTAEHNKISNLKLESLHPENLTFFANMRFGGKEATHWDDSHDWGGLNEGENPSASLLSVGLKHDTNEELKLHNFTPHFHHYTFIQLLICLAYLGTLTYTQGLIIGCEDEEHSRNIGIELREGLTILVPFTILIYDPGGNSKNPSIEVVFKLPQRLNLLKLQGDAPIRVGDYLSSINKGNSRSMWLCANSEYEEGFQEGEDAAGARGLTIDTQGITLNPHKHPHISPRKDKAKTTHKRNKLQMDAQALLRRMYGKIQKTNGPSVYFRLKITLQAIISLKESWSSKQQILRYSATYRVHNSTAKSDFLVHCWGLI